MPLLCVCGDIGNFFLINIDFDPNLFFSVLSGDSQFNSLRVRISQGSLDGVVYSNDLINIDFVEKSRLLRDNIIIEEYGL